MTNPDKPKEKDVCQRRANNKAVHYNPMLQLKSLSQQAEALKIVLKQAMQERKPDNQIAEISSQLTKVQTLIYERKIMLKRQGLFKE